MGLIRALAGSVSGTLADQWLEYFYCDSLEKDVLVVKGKKRESKRSSNKKGEENIISNGSIVAVNEGQCMMIVEQGKIVEFCAEPGEFKWDTSTSPSIFTGQLGGMFKTFVQRFKFGGDTGKDQRIYYFNLKELMDNKFGTAQPVPFRVVDSKIGLDIDVNIRCNGVFSYKITNPILFYQNVCGNVTEAYTRDKLDTQIKTEFLSKLQPAFGKLSELEIRPNQVVAHTAELENAINEELSDKWRDTRGIEIATIAIGSVTLPPEDAELIKNLQRQAVYRNAGMAAASIVEAQGEAMKAAASNANGAAMGFYGLNMASNAGGMNAQGLFNLDAQQQAQAQAQAQAAQAQAQAAGQWTCSCGAKANGKFCPECGSPKPAPAGQWTCKCGTVNTGKFCNECGSPKPVAGVCNNCGWKSTDGSTPKFCPECGNKLI